MARGWESKSVEEQQSAVSGADRQQPDPAEAAARASRQRERQELELMRERVLSERTSSPHRRAALEAALAEIEARLQAL